MVSEGHSAPTEKGRWVFFNRILKLSKYNFYKTKLLPC